MKKIAFTLLATAVGFTTLSAQAADFVSGKDYTVLANPEKIEGNKIIVREFFGMVARTVTTLSHICKNGQKPSLRTWYLCKPLRR